MKQVLLDYYLLIKALHVIAVISWMAGMFYCPRLFVYHTEAKFGAPDYERFTRMERRLLKMIMTPALILTWVLGLTLGWLNDWWMAHWFQLKLLLVAGLTLVNFNYFIWQKEFVAGKNRHTARYYKIWNEVPTVLMIAIVILVITKPL
jgi:putative membrane protein